MDADASKAIDDFEKDEELQKQLRDWRQNSKSGKKDRSESAAKDDVDDDDEEDEAAASKVVEQVLAEAALDDDADEDDVSIDDRIPAPPSKSLVRQIRRAITMSESENVSCVAFGRHSRLLTETLLVLIQQPAAYHHKFL